jgi:MYXO-CTERM domain-containing protein
VTLQNCDTQTIVFADPQVPAPFRIDSANFPRSLAPNESATFTVGFHPTRVGIFTDTLVITSQQLVDPLLVTVSGEGARPPPVPDAGVDPPGADERSFYGCSCSSPRSSPRSSPSGGLVIVVAMGVALRRRRRSPCS